MNEKGKPVERPFYEIAEELWDPSGKRFTLLIHPGRIKRGLKPREDLGPVLEAGKRYTLVIDRDWHDAEGNPLKAGYRKSFTAGPDDNTPIDVKTWKLAAPKAATAEPLVVRFPESLDHALLERVLWVVDERGQAVDGAINISEAETVWQFTPRKPWAAGRYELVAETTLEDLAGNAIGRPFEVDIVHPITKSTVAETAKIPFQVRGPAASRD